MEQESFDDDLPVYEATTPEVIQHDANVLIESFIHPTEIQAPSTLPKPFCLPQSGSGFDTPFARGYSDVFHHAGISQKTFLDFIDGLNMAMISSPPLQVVNVAGLVIGFVPHWTFTLAGALMQTGARVGMHVMSKTLSDRYLRAANERIFIPVGLRVRLCKTAALRVLLDHPDAGTPEPSRLKKFGQAAGTVVLRLPLPITKRAVRILMDKPKPVDPRIPDPVKRRLMMMEDHILPVEYGPSLPPPTRPENILDKMNGFAVGRTKKRVDRKEKSAAVRRQVLAGMPVSRKDYIMTKLASRGSNFELQTKVDDDARQEHRTNENLVWLVVLNEADDARIGGRDAIDDAGDQIIVGDDQLEQAGELYQEELFDAPLTQH